MTSSFKPQETELNSFHDTEKLIFSFFQQRGYSNVAATTAAHVFTQHLLGYISEGLAVRKLTDIGFDKQVAKRLVSVFADKGQKIISSDDTQSNVSKQVALM